MIFKIHHVGFEVENLQESIKFYQSLGFELVKTFKKEIPKAEATCLVKDKHMMEIWFFENPEEEMVPYIKKYIALEVDDIKEDIKSFHKNVFDIVVPSTKGLTVKNFAFVKDKKGNFFELYEKGI